MRTFLKRTLAVIMLVLMVLTSAPLSGLVGLEISSPLAVEAEAAGNYLWPVVNGTANSHVFNCSCSTHKGSHNGQDIAGAPYGQAILSPVDGVVTKIDKGCRGKSHLSSKKNCTKSTCNPMMLTSSFIVIFASTVSFGIHSTYIGLSVIAGSLSMVSLPFFAE